MLQIEKILKVLNQIAPFELCCDWDNCGLIVNSGKTVERVLLCLDVTKDTVDEARGINAELIISHHPVIFKPLKAMDYTLPVYQLCRDEISCIAMHTNLDAAQGGVNDILAEIINLKNVSGFTDVGRMGRLEPELTLTELTEKLALRLNYSPRFFDSGKRISTVAVVGGAGSFIEEAYKAGVDCLVTGELRHDDWLTAKRLSVSAIEAGHYATEKPIVCELYNKLTAELGDEAQFFVSKKEAEPNRLLLKGTI